MRAARDAVIEVLASIEESHALILRLAGGLLRCAPVVLVALHDGGALWLAVAERAEAVILALVAIAGTVDLLPKPKR